MQLGFSGHCPTTNLADIFAAAYDLWHKGQKREAFDMFGRIQALNSMLHTGTFDVMIARGVLRPGTKSREVAQAPPPGRRFPPRMTIDEIRQTLKTYLEPYLRG
jgi:hypothetical protein